jgi:trk system potassium uptake protein TrkA
MFILVIGGGKIGYHLVRTLKSEGHEVAVIEKDTRVCEAIADQFDVMVLNGDGTSPSLLREAGIVRADVVVAVAGRDQDNLVSCQIGKHLHGVKRTIARVNDPRNDELFRLLGVDALISVTSLVSTLIDQEISLQQMVHAMTMHHTGMVMVEATVTDDSSLVGKPVSQIKLPDHSILVSILRGEEVIIPRGDTILELKDDVVAITVDEQAGALREALSH